jgi:hypothetical protein
MASWFLKLQITGIVCVFLMMAVNSKHDKNHSLRRVEDLEPASIVSVNFLWIILSLSEFNFITFKEYCGENSQI